MLPGFASLLSVIPLVLTADCGSRLGTETWSDRLGTRTCSSSGDVQALLQVAPRSSPVAQQARPGEPLEVPGLGSLVGNELSGGFHEFMGIPYAVPPARFEAAVVNESWPQVLDATSAGPACIQPAREGISEDCLFLNVWTPSSAPKRLLPVWFWIHGGGLIYGAGSNPLYNGTVLSQRENVVVVTINYRLGALGFLSVGDDEATGGMNGWHDTLVALQWVKKHISAFGGDPGSLYIGGESGGAELTCYHLYSPETAAVGIAGVTLESGSCLGPWGPNNKRSGVDQSKQWMEEAFSCKGCDLVARAKEADVSLYIKMTPYGSSCCGPASVDGEYFQRLPLDGGFAAPAQIRVLLGMNHIDGIAPLSLKLPFTRAQLFNLIQKEGLSADLANKIIDFYLDTPGLDKITLPPLMFKKWTGLYWQIHRDAGNTCPTLFLAQELQRHGVEDVYLYYEDFDARREDFHGAEIPLFWGTGSWKPENAVNKTMDLLGSFLWGSQPSALWQSFSKQPGRQNYLNLSDTFALQSGYQRPACDFWRTISTSNVKQEFLTFGWH